MTRMTRGPKGVRAGNTAIWFMNSVLIGSTAGLGNIPNRLAPQRGVTFNITVNDAWSGSWERRRRAEAAAYLSCSLPLLALARSLNDGQVIFFGCRVTYSRSACAPQTPVAKRVTLNISSALASALLGLNSRWLGYVNSRR